MRYQQCGFLLVLALCLVSMTLIVPRIASAGQCSLDLRDVDLGAGQLVSLRDYNCRSGATGSSKIRVQYHRMTDLAFSSIIDRSAPPGVARIFGSSQIINTEPFTEYKTVMAKYGGYGMRTPKLIIETPPAGKGSSDISYGNISGQTVTAVAFQRTTEFHQMVRVFLIAPSALV